MEIEKMTEEQIIYVLANRLVRFRDVGTESDVSNISTQATWALDRLEDVSVHVKEIRKTIKDDVEQAERYNGEPRTTSALARKMVADITGHDTINDKWGKGKHNDP